LHGLDDPAVALAIAQDLILVAREGMRARRGQHEPLAGNDLSQVVAQPPQLFARLADRGADRRLPLDLRLEDLAART
jgi:hypothetical protein